MEAGERSLERGDSRSVDRRTVLKGSASGLAVATLGTWPGFVMSARAQQPSLTTVDSYQPTDTFFGKPVITKDEWRQGPIAHRLITGTFEGTDTRFGFYFPEKTNYQGRFIHFLQGGLGGTEPGSLVQVVDFGDNRANVANPYASLGNYLALAVSLGAYLVESNQGHIGSTECKKGGKDASIYGYRASAESARFARHLAKELYGKAPHHGYVYGGSGGARRSVNCIENVDDVWSGALPFMGGGAVVQRKDYDPKRPAEFTSQGFAAMFNVQRLLGPKLADVVDAVDPGGSGDPFATLNSIQRQALADLFSLGYPRGDELIIAYPAGQIGQWAWTAESLKAQDPRYWSAFWTESGYVGKDEPHLVANDLIDTEIRVRKVITAGDLAKAVASGGQAAASPMAARAASLPKDMAMAIEIDKPKGYLLGASLKFTTGNAAGRQLWCTNVNGDMLLCDGIGEAGNLKYKGVVAGDKLKINNRDFLAYCYYYRYHAMTPQLPEAAAFRVDGGKPIYPQRAPNYSEVLFGPAFTASTKNKILFVQHTHDASLWPGKAISYAKEVQRVLGKDADSHFRLRWVQNAEHGGPPLIPIIPAPTTRLINAAGHIEQNLHDLMAWVEQGKVPATDRYTYEHAELKLPDTAVERGGIQVVVHAKANGAARAEVKAGADVTFSVDAEVPKGAGNIIMVEWDFDGAGKYPYKDSTVEGTKSKVFLSTQYRFDKPGTYFPAVRVTSHREGDVKATLRRVNNLGRVRVVVT